jgi:hypothetical protein
MRGLASCSNHGDARRSELLNRSELKIGILGGRQFWPISIDTEVSSSFSWFAAIQGIERIEDLAGLAPKGCFMAAEAIKRKAQKSTSSF